MSQGFSSVSDSQVERLYGTAVLESFIAHKLLEQHSA